ncbi:MAG: hypothetical protein ABMA64_08600 [Myxococcota bacterium]
MPREPSDPGLDVHEAAYVRGPGGPVDDTGVHTSRDTGVPPDRHAAPTRRSTSGEPVGVERPSDTVHRNLRASLRSKEEVERERADELAARQRATRRLAVPIVLVVTLALGCAALTTTGAIAGWMLTRATGAEAPIEHEGVPVRRLGDEPR